MPNTLSSNPGALFTLSEVINRVINWVFVFVLAFALSVDDFGVVSVLISVESILVIAIMAGFDRAAVRFISDRREGVAAWDITICWILVALVVLAFTLISLLVRDWATEVFLPGYTVWLFLGSCFFLSLLRLLAAICRATGNTGAFVILRVGFIALKAFLFFGIIYSINDVALVYFGSTLVAAIIAISITIRHGLKRYPNVTKQRRNIIFYALPFLPHAISGVILASIDRVMIEAMMTTHEVGIYNFAYLLGSSLSFVYAVIAVTYEPLLFSNSFDTSKVEHLQNTYFRLLNTVGFIALPTLLIAIQIINFLTDKYAHRDFFFVALTVMISYIVNIHYLKASYYLAVAKQSVSIALVTFLSMCLNVGLNLILIEPLGIRGAAIATLASYLFLSLVMTLMASYRTQYRISDEKNTLYIFCCALAFITLWINEYLVIPIALTLVALTLKDNLSAARVLIQPGLHSR